LRDWHPRHAEAVSSFDALLMRLDVMQLFRHRFASRVVTGIPCLFLVWACMTVLSEAILLCPRLEHPARAQTMPHVGQCHVRPVLHAGVSRTACCHAAPVPLCTWLYSVPRHSSRRRPASASSASATSRLRATLQRPQATSQVRHT
jgi:hypothetical protein